MVPKLPLWPPEMALQALPPEEEPPEEDELLELELEPPPELELEELELEELELPPPELDELELPPGTTEMAFTLGFCVPATNWSTSCPPALAVAVNDRATA